MRTPATALLPQYIYEYRKGVRRLFLLTMTPIEAYAVSRRLESESIDVHVQTVNTTKMNVFFGLRACVEVVRQMVTGPLCHLSAEEDFVLGTMLGYDTGQQCERYLERRHLAARAQPASTRDCAVPDGSCAAWDSVCFGLCAYKPEMPGLPEAAQA